MVFTVTKLYAGVLLQFVEFHFIRFYCYYSTWYVPTTNYNNVMQEIHNRADLNLYFEHYSGCIDDNSKLICSLLLKASL